MAAGRVVRLDDRGVLELSGAELRPFLQGLLTNDVDRLTGERAIWAALLTPQGRCLFDFGLALDGGRVLLDGERGRLAELVRRLALYRLRAAAEFRDASADWAVLALPEPEAAARFDLPAERGACRRDGEAVLLVDPRLAALGLRVLLPVGAVEGFLARYGLEAGDALLWDRHRLVLGVPDGSRDLVPEKALALEANLLELDVVSLAKGCFVGQELTARMAHRTLLRRRLVPVRVDGPLPAPGTPVIGQGREQGEVRSGRDDRALALLRLEALGAGGLAAGEARLEPEPPAWLAAALAAG
jgi:hypothetical protein